MPIIPLHNISSLLPTLLGFQKQVHAARSNRMPANPLTTLLPYCSSNPPLPERVLNVLSEVCSSIPHLSQIATSRDGQQYLRDLLPESVVPGHLPTQTVEDIIEFWQQETFME